MVLASTSDCYGRNPEVPFSEESVSVIGSPHVRRWSYAVSKMFEEQALFGFRERYGSRRWRCGCSGATDPSRTSPGGAGRSRCSSARRFKGEPLEVHGSGPADPQLHLRRRHGGGLRSGDRHARRRRGAAQRRQRPRDHHRGAGARWSGAWCATTSLGSSWCP